jgi:hypothetical protein
MHGITQFRPVGGRGSLILLFRPDVNKSLFVTAFKFNQVF